MRLSVQLGQLVPQDVYLAPAWPSCAKYLMPMSRPSYYRRGLLRGGGNLQQQAGGAVNTPPCLVPGHLELCLAEKSSCSQTGTNRDVAASRRLSPRALRLLTITSLMKRHQMGWAAGAGLTGVEMLPPLPKRNPTFLPAYQPQQPSFDITRHHKTSCLQRSTHKELFHIVF